MTVDIFILSEYANNHGSRLNIIGTIDSIKAKQVPIVIPTAALAIRMRFEKIKEGEKKVRISVIDSDGKAVMPTLQANMNVKVPANASHATVPLILHIQPLKLPHFGEYQIGLAIDGRQEASIPLFAHQIQPPAQPLPPPENQK